MDSLMVMITDQAYLSNANDGERGKHPWDTLQTYTMERCDKISKW